METKIIALVFFAFSYSITYAQSIEDTKDFIIEKVEANDPISAYDNTIFFNSNILWSDINKLAGKTLSESEFKHSFVYARDCYFDGSRTKWWLTVAQIIDVRDIIKVSTTRNVGEDNYYTITVYVGNKYYAKEFGLLVMNDEPEFKYLSKMEILISDNEEIAKKIKKAILHLANSSGAKAIDGDMF